MTVRYPSPAHRKQVAKQRDAELAQAVREAQPPTPTGPVEYPYAGNLLPTLPGMAHGIIGSGPWRVQCDGCGAVETLELLVLMRRTRTDASDIQASATPDRTGVNHER